MTNTIQLRPRYYRWHVDEGVAWTEANTAHAHLDWQVPLSQAALVLLDVWPGHYLLDTATRIEQIVEQQIRPLLAVCRNSGLQIIHAPSPGQAQQHPERLPSPIQEPVPAAWPPAEFRNKTGPYADFARPFEPRDHEIVTRRVERTIHPQAMPEGKETVVADGDQLHQYCEEQGILFLIYAGFNTNACIVLRDYGIPVMSQRGYETILLRDCTTAMESCETLHELRQTRETILMLEMFTTSTITCDELLAGLSGAGSTGTTFHDSQQGRCKCCTDRRGCPHN